MYSETQVFTFVFSSFSLKFNRTSFLDLYVLLIGPNITSPELKKFVLKFSLTFSLSPYLISNSGLLFPQGRTSYFQGIKNKNYYPSSVPKSFKVNILRDNGVYNKPYEAAADIIALSRMNWRHITYIPSIYPISLEYSLIIAQNLKNNIIPTGDLIKLPWFL